MFSQSQCLKWAGVFYTIWSIQYFGILVSRVPDLFRAHQHFWHFCCRYSVSGWLWHYINQSHYLERSLCLFVLKNVFLILNWLQLKVMKMECLWNVLIVLIFYIFFHILESKHSEINILKITLFVLDEYSEKCFCKL